MVSSEPIRVYRNNVVSLDDYLTEPVQSYKDYVVGMVTKEFSIDEKGDVDPYNYSFMVDIDKNDGVCICCNKSDGGAKKYLYDVLSALTVAVTPETRYIGHKVEIPDMANVDILYDYAEHAMAGEFSVSVRRKITPIYPIEDYEVIEGFGLF